MKSNSSEFTYPGNERQSTRSNDGPRLLTIYQVLKQGAGTGDLNRVVAILLREKTLHVLNVWHDSVLLVRCIA